MNNSEALISSLPEHRVDVVEAGEPARRHWNRCEIGRDLTFDTAGLEAYCLANWDETVFDAFVLAAAVQFCDQTKARPKTGWGRDLALRIPVHNPERWSAPAVSTALHEALCFLTGDRWQITFKARRVMASRPQQGRFSMPDASRVIIPFSDGLDSRAVSALMELEFGHRLIRVHLGPKPWKTGDSQSQRPPFALVPYSVRFGKIRSVETSARSRGFKFALLSGIAAYLSETSEIIVPESGQGALGPVLVPVGQAYEDYRNHPLFTDRMQAFISALFDHEVRYSYPRLWHTKGETLAAYAENTPDGDNWRHTRSCWQGQRQVSVNGRRRQCGICAACMLRRVSVHAIGCAEDRETYVWEDLSVSGFEDGIASGFELKKPRGAFYQYAIGGTLHLDHLAALRHSSVNQRAVNRKTLQLSRSLALSEAETGAKIDRLLKKHEEEWKNFVASLGPQSFVAQWALGAQ